MKAIRIIGVVALVLVLAGLVLGATCAGPQGEQGAKGDPGATGVGIQSIVNNGNGTFAITLTNGSTYTTDNLTGPQGPQGPKGDPFMVVSKPDFSANDRFVDGVWKVGTDIRPGLYWTPTAGGYWARLSGFGGTISDIIANGNNAGPTYVQIATTDAGFQSDRCSYWIRVGD